MCRCDCPCQLLAIYFNSRPWYANAGTLPKDIVILIDTSAAMKRKLIYAKEIARLLLQTANRNDQVIGYINSDWDIMYLFVIKVLTCWLYTRLVYRRTQ